MAVFTGYYALGTGVSNLGVFQEATGYTRPVVALGGDAISGMTQALAQITGPTGPTGGRISNGAIFDSQVGGNCLCHWHWTTATTIPNNFLATTVDFVFNTYMQAALNLSAIGGAGTSGSTVGAGQQIGQVSGNPLTAGCPLIIQSGWLIAAANVPSASAVSAAG